MNNNEESLISHALKLYGVQYDDNIELKYGKCILSNREFIQVGDRNIQNSYMLSVYNWFGDINMQMYKNRNTSLNLDINIRSFINHWMQYFNFYTTINRAAVWKCSHNKFDIAILGNDNCWHYILGSPCLWVDGWIIYNW